ncbi:hypothetical protein HYPSUDRAFT_207062 [Hypholoma sublateritium FD-334 SS-4]|uniref:Uncharacterized protein n=1 Tax=Hypholoma sublateritium (strain FD-334 SS-4) TaxID=945553 RepID=A0A0D2LZV6_HYPSF|nr:hypothetical protein HYPSUDRAFT_207062 [Hypholoma sublateritium FD-334 SS-4]
MREGGLTQLGQPEAGARPRTPTPSRRTSVTAHTSSSYTAFESADPRQDTLVVIAPKATMHPVRSLDLEVRTIITDGAALSPVRTRRAHAMGGIARRRMRALHVLTEAHYNVSARSSLSVRISRADEIEVLAISRKSLSQNRAAPCSPSKAREPDDEPTPGLAGSARR